MRFNLRCGLPAPASLAGWLNSDVERLLSYVQFSKAKDSNRCLWRALHKQRLLPLEGREREAAMGPDADIVRKLGRRGRCSPLHPWQFSAQHRRTQKAMHSMLFFVPNKWSYSVRRLWYLSRLLWIFSSNLDEQPHDFRFHSLRGSGL